ncbi:hypothetical protein [Amnibacterium endophyticum]|uniref:Cardiolipin synthase N-terminal domain-containing protein n=1 Tax=Amnibacterium endophyticum TaxID=2109337 RepID=A0ABW4LHH6_9MICO
MTFTPGTAVSVVLIAAGAVIDTLMILLFVRRSRRPKTAQERDGVPWPLAALFVLGFVAILVGAAAFR